MNPAGLLFLSLLLGGGTAAIAQESVEEDPAAAPGKPNWRITPTMGVNMTLTDNVSLGQDGKRSDFITQISPGLRVNGKSARATGNLAFSWQHFEYARDDWRNNQQKSLAADGKLELVEQLLFIDARANIAQRPISAFGKQSVGNELSNTNNTETTTYQWSPYLKGNFAGAVDYELRYSTAQTSAATGVYSNSSGTTTDNWTGLLSGNTPLTMLGWSVRAETMRTESGAALEMRSEKLIGTLEYRITPQIRLLLNAGKDADNYMYGKMEQDTTSGYGLEWAPTERSLLSLKKDKMRYGDSHNFSFTHRTALSAWKISDSRSVMVPAQQMTQAPVSSAYELLNLQLSSSIQDPQERANAVYQMLQQAGISPDQLVYGNIMSMQPMTQRRQEASVSLLGANNTVTLTLQRSTSDSVGTPVGQQQGDFALSSSIEQSGISGSWAHKLSPHSALTLNALSTRSDGGTNGQSTKMNSLSLLLTHKLGVRTASTIGLRHTSFDNGGTTITTGTTNNGSYDERALTGSLLHTF